MRNFSNVTRTLLLCVSLWYSSLLPNFRKYSVTWSIVELMVSLMWFRFVPHFQNSHPVGHTCKFFGLNEYCSCVCSNSNDRETCCLLPVLIICYFLSSMEPVAVENGTSTLVPIIFRQQYFFNISSDKRWVDVFYSLNLNLTIHWAHQNLSFYFCNFSTRSKKKRS